MSTSLECHREGVNGEVGMDCMRGGQRRKHIVVCRVDGNTVNLNIGNMIADIRRNRVFRRIAAVVCRITDRSNCAMRASRGGNDRLHRERNDRRGRLCAKHRHDRAVGTTDDEVFYSVAIHIAITETRTVGKPNIVGEHADRCCAAWQGGQSLISTLVGRDAPIAPFTQIRPHVTGRVARNDVGKAIMVDVSHNRRGASVRNDQCRSIHIRENRHAVRAGRRITRNDAYTPIHAASDKFVTAVAVDIVSIRHGAVRTKRNDRRAAGILQHVARGCANIGFRNAVAVHVGESHGRALASLSRDLDIHPFRLEVRPCPIGSVMANLTLAIGCLLADVQLAVVPHRHCLRVHLGKYRLGQRVGSHAITGRDGLRSIRGRHGGWPSRSQPIPCQIGNQARVKYQPRPARRNSSRVNRPRKRIGFRIPLVGLLPRNSRHAPRDDARRIQQVDSRRPVDQAIDNQVRHVHGLAECHGHRREYVGVRLARSFTVEHHLRHRRRLAVGILVPPTHDERTAHQQPRSVLAYRRAIEGQHINAIFRAERVKAGQRERRVVHLSKHDAFKRNGLAVPCQRELVKCHIRVHRLGAKFESRRSHDNSFIVARTRKRTRQGDAVHGNALLAVGRVACRIGQTNHQRCIPCSRHDDVLRERASRQRISACRWQHRQHRFAAANILGDNLNRKARFRQCSRDCQRTRIGDAVRIGEAAIRRNGKIGYLRRRGSIHRPRHGLAARRHIARLVRYAI